MILCKWLYSQYLGFIALSKTRNSVKKCLKISSFYIDKLACQVAIIYKDWSTAYFIEVESKESGPARLFTHYSNIHHTYWESGTEIHYLQIFFSLLIRLHNLLLVVVYTCRKRKTLKIKIANYFTISRNKTN